MVKVKMKFIYWMCIVWISNILFFPAFSSRCDVAKEEDWTILWEYAETFFDDKVSILVNNAGVNPGLGWKTCIDVMLLGVGFGTFQAIEKMGISKVFRM